MSDTNTAFGEQPAPATAPVRTPGEQPAVQDNEAILDSLDQSQLEAYLFGGEGGIPESTTVPETPPTPGAQPKPAAPTTESEKDEPSSLRRLALGGVEMSERQLMADATARIRSGEAKTLVEALSQLGALPQSSPTSADPAAQADPIDEPAAPQTPDAIQAQINELYQQAEQADDDFDKPLYRQLTRDARALELDLIRAEQAAQIQHKSATDYHGQYLEQVDAAEAKYEWMTEPESPQYQFLDDKVTAAKARGDTALQDPAFIMNFADQIAKQFAPARPGTPATVPAPPPAKTRLVGSGVAPGHSEAHMPTRAEAEELIRNASKDELAAQLFG